jgi:hypothetical protein
MTVWGDTIEKRCLDRLPMRPGNSNRNRNKRDYPWKSLPYSQTGVHIRLYLSTFCWRCRIPVVSVCNVAAPSPVFEENSVAEEEAGEPETSRSVSYPQPWNLAGRPLSGSYPYKVQANQRRVQKGGGDHSCGSSRWLEPTLKYFISTSRTKLCAHD